jgi:hypothetical protein
MDQPEVEPTGIMDQPEQLVEEVNDVIEEEELQTEEENPEMESEVSSLVDTSSIQISPTPKSLASSMVDEYEIDLMLYIQLGDHVFIDSTLYGKTIGTVYYRSLEFIHVRPMGVSNKVYVYELEQTDDEEKYKEEYGVKQAYILEKRDFESFVLQQDFRTGQIIDTFEASGTLYKRYKITGVDKDNDSIKIAEIGEEGEVDEETERELPFQYVGIDPSEPFQVISISDYGITGPENAPNELNVVVKDPTLEDIEQEPMNEEDFIVPDGEIEIIRPRVYVEAASYEQIIPDEIQKVDALNDFISNLDLSAQKNAKVIREQRLLVETLHQLKQESISYYEDGTVRGPKIISASTLSELITMAPIPLGRPVLDITKKAYKLAADDPEDALQDTDTFVFSNFHKNLIAKMDNYTAIISTPPHGAGTQIREWVDKANFFKSYLTPWMPRDMEVPIWSAIRDSEFFRTVAPSLADLSENSSMLIPTVEGYLASHTKDVAPEFDQILFGMERALSTSYRKSSTRTRQVFMDEEKASLVSYLLFPLRSAPYVGSKRTYSLAIDSGRSQLPFKTMRTVLEEIGDPKEENGTSKDIILINTTASAYGSIRVEDYLAGQTIPALGLGDTFYVLNQYGLDELELNERIAEVLTTKISLYQQQLISTLAELRTKLTQAIPKTPEINPLIPSPNFLISIKTQPILLEAIEEYERMNPTMSTSDLGIVNHLMKRYNNYFQVTAGNNNFYISKAFYEENNRQFHQQQRINYVLETNRKHAGKPPKRNRCRHVADMVAVRKIQDDDERFYQLTRVYRNYQGARVDNWFHCNLCKEHFLCIHERLQLQAYLNPVEKSIIEKEILLKCSGGQFQGKYICRNCGQTIRELDFDNNLEFDDEGRPKSGRAVVEDRDAILEEKIDMMISAPVESSEKDEMNLNDSERICYEIVRELAERVGIELDRAGFRFIIQHTLLIMSSFPDRTKYNMYRQTNPNKIPTYDVGFSRKYIAVCSGLLLVEIQTKMPSYKIRYALRGCSSPGFGGYPLEDEKTSIEGMEYLACAIATIQRKDGIFSQTGYNLVQDPEVRKKGIVRYIQEMMDKDILKLDMVQSNLSAKRAYLSEVGGASGAMEDTRPRDKIPATFLPEQIILKPEEAAQDVISPEVAQSMGSRGNTALVKLWIRQAHALAKNNVKLVRGSPLSEVSCCFHPITSQADVWFNQFPSLGLRTILPNQQGRFMVTEFIPRSTESSVAKPDSELYYRLFLKYCFDGPNTGRPHEPGLTNMCTWCGFQFPSHPLIMDTEKEGKTAISSQNVDTSEDAFTSLLDTIHDVNRVEGMKSDKVGSVEEIMTKFSDIDHPVVSDWKEVIQETTQNFIQLPPNADRSDLVQALARVSNATLQSAQLLQTYFPKKGANETVYELLEEISKLSWINFFQVIQTYFITTFQRLLTQYSEKALFVPVELTKDLSDIHVKEDLMPKLENELLIIKQYQEKMKKAENSFVRSKISYCLKQLSAVLPYKNIIRSTLVPGRDKALVYIQQLILFGAIATMIDPDHIPDESMGQNPLKSSGQSSSKFVIQLLGHILMKYRRERISYNEEEIRVQIAIREEKERVYVIREFNKLTEEERQVELMNKRLGIGKWAVGGTSLTYKYNPEYYDLERHKREEAGIGSHPDERSHQFGEMGREYDEFGLPMMNEAEREEAAGYEVGEVMDD